MGLNPFKDSNLNDLQRNTRDFLGRHFGEFSKRIGMWWDEFVRNGREQITIMFIPHSEKKIVNFHVTKFTIAFFVVFVATTVIVTSIAIINHTSTIKQVSKLKLYRSNSRVQIQKYREEINRLYDIFQRFKPEITYLYSLTPDNNVDSLWAKGAGPDPNPGTMAQAENSPPIEILNIEEVERELKTSKQILQKVKQFLQTRKKILENTPSLWPVDGYIISGFGERTSPYTFRKEFHQGIDIAAFPGAEIRSTAPGKVTSVRWDPLLGLTVSVKHKYGFSTHYSHCQRVSVETNEKVSKGEVIGYVGRTGKATRHICFYQIKIGTEFVDPAPYINTIIR